MCREVQCRKCSKPTWAGCGAHVEQVLRHVPKSQRCSCREEARAAKAAGKSAPDARPGFFARLFGRG